jgi:hypothetical protein
MPEPAPVKISPTARDVPLEWVLDYLASLERGLEEIDEASRQRVVDYAREHSRRIAGQDQRDARVQYLEGMMNGLDLLPTPIAHRVYKHGARSCQGVFDQNLAAKFGYDGQSIQSWFAAYARYLDQMWGGSHCAIRDSQTFLSDASTGGCACPLIAHRHVNILDPMHTNRCECTAAWFEVLFEKFPGEAVEVEVKELESALHGGGSCRHRIYVRGREQELVQIQASPAFHEGN